MEKLELKIGDKEFSSKKFSSSDPKDFMQTVIDCLSEIKAESDKILT